MLIFRIKTHFDMPFTLVFTAKHNVLVVLKLVGSNQCNKYFKNIMHCSRSILPALRIIGNAGIMSDLWYCPRHIQLGLRYSLINKTTVIDTIVRPVIQQSTIFKGSISVTNKSHSATVKKLDLTFFWGKSYGLKLAIEFSFRNPRHP